MLDTVIAHADTTEPGIHPIAAEIRDIILAKAAEGEPTMDIDLDHLAPADITAHFPAAKHAANKLIVRQVGDNPVFETRTQLLIRASGLLLNRLPTAPEMHSTLRRNGLSNNEIAELWPDLLAAVGEALPHRRSLPQLRAVS